MTGPLICLDPAVTRAPRDPEGNLDEVLLEWPATGRRVRMGRSTYQLAQRFAIPATVADVADDLGATEPAGHAAVVAAVERLRGDGVLTEWQPGGVVSGPGPRGLFGATVLALPDALRGPARAVVLGVPFDGGVTYRAGTKFAPDDLRRVSSALIDLAAGAGFHDPVTGRRVLEDVPIADIGNVHGAPGDHGEHQLGMLTDVIEAIGAARRTAVVLGGDHSITLPIVDGLVAAYGNVGVIHVDAHHDYGGARTDARERVHHGNFLDWVVGDPGVAAVAQIGVRQLTREAPAAHPKLVRWPGQSAVAAGIDAVVGRLPRGLPWHLSIDVDVLDPSVMPTTGTLLPGGWSHRDLVGLVRLLAARLNLVGIDLVEFIPGSDAGALTACDVLLRALDATFTSEGDPL